jgi:hemerythrin superfamily protein
MKATELLKSDHRIVESLFAQLKTSPEPDKAAVVEQIRSELSVHSMIEEEIFYPAMRALDPAPIDEAVDEHRALRNLLDLVATMPPGSAELQELLDELQELIGEHVEEEEKVLFVRAEELGDTLLQELGRRMNARKEELAGDFVFQD